jgi:beta-glucosidase
VDAAQRLREGGRPVACAHWAVPTFPARTDPDAPPSAEAEVLARTTDQIHHGCWVRLLEEGQLAIPGRTPVEVPSARQAFDIVGVTYRHAMAVRGDGAVLPYPQALEVGPDGQVPWTQGLGIVLHRLAEDLPGRPLLIAGVGLTTDDEGRRRDYLRDLLRTAEAALDDGIDLRGLWWHTPIDPRFPAGEDAVSGAAPGLWDHERNPRAAEELLTSVAHGGPITT